ncbi:MAG: glycosyltransferase family 39 protein [Chloroflexi bacterium]|nr:glycosyltransferase family 39 protein [Chloroflexota bacterium]
MSPTFTRKTALTRFLTPLTILALGLIAVYPILFGPSLPCSDDAAFHLLRLTQLDHLIQQGVLYSRWAPDMAHGYGFPLFNFYAPLSYYVAEAISLIGPGGYLGMRLTLALAVGGGGFSMYRLARDHFSHEGALLAAIAYLYAPYQGYDIYFRGNLAEAVAWPLLPLALWAMGRLMRSGSRGWLAAAAFTYAIVLLTHNVFALIFSPLLALYAAAEATSQHAHGQMRPRLFQAGLSLSLALGLSAFFWLPAMAEQTFVHIDRLLVPPVFVYWNNFLSLGELLTLPRTIHPDLLNPSPPRGLGLVPVLVAMMGLGGLRWWRKVHSNDSRPRQILFFGLALLVYCFLMLPLSQPLWDQAPLLPFVQFPWRLLGPAAVCLAMLVAAAGDWLASRPREGQALWALVAAALILTALFWFQPRYCAGLENPTASDIIAYEQATATIGTTAKGEYLPVTVPRFPPEPEVALAPLAAETLSPQVSIISQDARPLRIEAVLQASEAQVIRLNQFDYPGWRVWVDGERVPITPDPEFGLITFPLPAGEHRVRAAFGETPLRLAADLVSLLGLLILLALVGGSIRQRRLMGSPMPSARPERVNGGPLLLGLVLFGLVVGLLPRWSTPFIQPGLQQDSVRGLAVPLPTDFGGGMRLLGYERSGSVMRPGETMRLDLFWTVTTGADRNFQTNIAWWMRRGFCGVPSLRRFLVTCARPRPRWPGCRGSMLRIAICWSFCRVRRRGFTPCNWFFLIRRRCSRWRFCRVRCRIWRWGR